MTMTYDGVTQTIDAATADVTIGDAAPLYDAPFPAPAAPCGDQLWSTGAAAVDGAESGLLRARLSATRPYVAGLGWAPEGSRWLVVHRRPGRADRLRGPARHLPRSAPPASRRRTPSASTSPSRCTPPTTCCPTPCEPDPLDPQVVVFEVPEDRETGQMDIRTRLTGELAGPRRRARTARALVVQGAFV